MLRFDVFGREVGVLREEARWRAVFVGREGKHRAAPSIAIPSSLPEAELGRFLADLFHESASPERPDVVPLNRPSSSRRACRASCCTTSGVALDAD